MVLLLRCPLNVLPPLAGAQHAVNFAVNAVLQVVKKPGFICSHGAAVFAVQLHTVLREVSSRPTAIAA